MQCGIVRRWLVNNIPHEPVVVVIFWNIYKSSYFILFFILRGLFKTLSIYIILLNSMYFLGSEISKELYSKPLSSEHRWKT